MEQLAAWLTGSETIEFREGPVPQPGPGELLLSVGAAVTCGTDVKVYRRGGHPRMLEVPSPFGHEMAGTIIGLGEGVDGWREGERIVVSNSASCGSCDFCRRGDENLCADLLYLNGAFARYLLVPARFVDRGVYRIPGGLDFAVAALGEPLACVLHGIGKLAPQPGESGALFGAGPIGLLFTAVLSAGGWSSLLPIRTNRAWSWPASWAPPIPCLSRGGAPGRNGRVRWDRGRRASISPSMRPG